MLNDNLSMVGTVLPNNDVNVLSEAQGRITHMNVKVGDAVSSEVIIATVDDELKTSSPHQRAS